MKEFGQWLRHKVRVVILKQWNKDKNHITESLLTLNAQLRAGFTQRYTQTANSDWGVVPNPRMENRQLLTPPKVLAQRTRIDRVCGSARYFKNHATHKKPLYTGARYEIRTSAAKGGCG